MATLKSLYKDGVPDPSIKVRHESFDKDVYVQFYYRASNYITLSFNFYGVTSNYFSKTSNENREGWELYTEPQKTVTYYEYVCKFGDGKNLYTENFTEEMFETNKTIMTWFQRTGRSFEVPI